MKNVAPIVKLLGALLAGLAAGAGGAEALSTVPEPVVCPVCVECPVVVPVPIVEPVVVPVTEVL